MRTLIAGAQGFTGRYVVACWLAVDPDVEIVGIGRSAPDTEFFTHNITLGNMSRRAPLSAFLKAAAQDPRYSYRSIDLLDRDRLLKLLSDLQPDIILNLASGLRDDPSEYLFRTNVLGTEVLFDAVSAAATSRRGFRPRVVVASSGSTYGLLGDDQLPVVEDTPLAPFDMYSISKCAQEQVARMLGIRYRLPVVIARIFNIVGPGQDERHFCGWLAAQIAAIEAGKMPSELTIGPLTTTRDFIDVRDVANAIVIVSRNGREDSVYNVASGCEAHMQDIYDTMVNLCRTAQPLCIRQRSGRPVDMLRNVADISRLRELGAEPRLSLKESVADLLQYYRALFDSETLQC